MPRLDPCRPCDRELIANLDLKMKKEQYFKAFASKQMEVTASYRCFHMSDLPIHHIRYTEAAAVVLYYRHHCCLD